MRFQLCFLSPAARTTLFFFTSAIVLVAIAAIFSSAIPLSGYSYSAFSGNKLWGCLPDGEGSWSIGVFYGDSPFSLKPIESWNVWRNRSAAWPVANPVFSCASASDAGFPSNFVADPFLYLDVSCYLPFSEVSW